MQFVSEDLNYRFCGCSLWSSNLSLVENNYIEMEEKINLKVGSGIERSDDFEWLNMKIKPILRTDEST